MGRPAPLMPRSGLPAPAEPPRGYLRSVSVCILHQTGGVKKKDQRDFNPFQWGNPYPWRAGETQSLSRQREQGVQHLNRTENAGVMAIFITFYVYFHFKPFLCHFVNHLTYFFPHPLVHDIHSQKTRGVECHKWQEIQWPMPFMATLHIFPTVNPFIAHFQWGYHVSPQLIIIQA